MPMGFKHSEASKRKISQSKMGHVVSMETRAKIRDAELGKKSKAWKGGRIIDGRGYIRIWAPYHPYANHQGYVFEHRLICEQKLGRMLTPEETCHHINGIRSDNCPENLEVFVNKNAHQAFHEKKKKEKIK